MSRFGATIRESDSKILESLYSSYGWYSPVQRPLPQFEPLPPLARRLPLEGAAQQSQFPIQQQQVQQQIPVQQVQQPLQQIPAQQVQPLQQTPSQQFPVQEFQQQVPASQLPLQFLQSQIPQVELQFGEIPAIVVELGEFDQFRSSFSEERTVASSQRKKAETRVSYREGNLNDWKQEARSCIDKILQLNNKAYNRVNLLENFKFVQGGSTDAQNFSYRLRRNLDTLVKENERLRAELDSGSVGGIVQGVNGTGSVSGGVMQGGVDMAPVIKPSDIKKAHYVGEKVGQWKPQPENHTITERVKDAAVGLATRVENVALHPIETAKGVVNTVENIALHPIQTVERAADAVIHTVM